MSYGFALPSNYPVIAKERSDCGNPFSLVRQGGMRIATGLKALAMTYESLQAGKNRANYIG